MRRRTRKRHGRGCKGIFERAFADHGAYAGKRGTCRLPRHTS
jgi:hypothetical protein